METFYNYKGYGIRYTTITGSTFVEKHGKTEVVFIGKGEIEGDKLARAFIDLLVDGAINEV